jgi:pimeloyl-ACP methyl ester carboxylesterase
MDTCAAGDGSIEYRVRGSGEPLLLIHGAIFSDAFEPIADALSSSYQLITYRRRAFGGSSPARPGGTIADQAADAVALLDHLSVGAAHIVGHSYGGAVALQLALDAPTRAHSLVLLEPPMLAAPSFADFGAGAGVIGEIYQKGDAEGTLVAFLTAVGGDDPVARVSKTLPSSWHERALADLPALFEADLPSLGGWQFTEAQARSINQPALNVLGSNSAPLFADSHRLLADWLPAAEPFVLDGATHLLQIDDPDGIAKGILNFVGRHPIAN